MRSPRSSSSGPRVCRPWVNRAAAARGSVRGDQLAEPDCVGADGVRGGPGKYLHRILTGGIGHNLPQEAPLDFVHAIEEVSNFT